MTVKTGPRPIAKARYVRISPSKLRRYANLVKGKKYDLAVAELGLMPSPTAALVRKVLVSAGANAEENCDMVKEQTYVKTITVDQGPTLKRWLPRAMGRATRIRKRTSHLFIELAEKGI
jgi:large subunit ribosomal protein L22